MHCHQQIGSAYGQGTTNDSKRCSKRKFSTQGQIRCLHSRKKRLVCKLQTQNATNKKVVHVANDALQRIDEKDVLHAAQEKAMLVAVNKKGSMYSQICCLCGC